MSDTFNMHELDQNEAFGGTKVLPDSGDYNLMISAAATEINKNANGTNAVMAYTVLDGPFQGYEHKEWLAVINKSAEAQRIARERLKAIQIVTKSQGQEEIGSLVGKTMRARFIKAPHQFIDKTTGQTRNSFNITISNYMDMNNKNARGEPVAVFVPALEVAKAPVNTSSASGGGSNQQSSAQSSTSKQLDDDIPF